MVIRTETGGGGWSEADGGCWNTSWWWLLGREIGGCRPIEAGGGGWICSWR